MAKKDRIVFRPRRAVPADAIALAIARGPHPAGSGDHDQGRIGDRNTAKVIPIGQGKFGVIWNSLLRSEKYPKRGLLTSPSLRCS